MKRSVMSLSLMMALCFATGASAQSVKTVSKNCEKQCVQKCDGKKVGAECNKVAACKAECGKAECKAECKKTDCRKGAECKAECKKAAACKDNCRKAECRKAACNKQMPAKKVAK